MYLLDFTIIWNGEEIYWEHVGKISDEKYVSHWHNRLRTTYEMSPDWAPDAPLAPLDVSRQADNVISALHRAKKRTHLKRVPLVLVGLLGVEPSTNGFWFV